MKFWSGPHLVSDLTYWAWFVILLQWRNVSFRFNHISPYMNLCNFQLEENFSWEFHNIWHEVTKSKPNDNPVQSIEYFFRASYLYSCLGITFILKHNLIGDVTHLCVRFCRISFIVKNCDYFCSLREWRGFLLQRCQTSQISSHFSDVQNSAFQIKETRKIMVAFGRKIPEEMIINRK